MNSKKVIDHISQWLKTYSEQAVSHGFIVGISGGIDSAVTSTLCALTQKKVVCVSMPIHQKPDQLERANEHIAWLKARFSNVSDYEVNLTDTFESFRKTIPHTAKDHLLSMANTRSRLRMVTLYAIGQSEGLLVAGTGNKIEDFGVGFYTKYGDGGVDISPIADLTKTEIYTLAAELNIVNSIQNAPPTDGLWDTDRCDEDQLGATYPELEWAMEYINSRSTQEVSKRQEKVLEIYKKFNRANQHKMNPIPVCLVPDEIKKEEE